MLGRRWKLLLLDNGADRLGPGLAALDIGGMGFPEDTSVVGVVLHSNQWERVGPGESLEQIAVAWSVDPAMTDGDDLRQVVLQSTREDVGLWVKIFYGMAAVGGLLLLAAALGVVRWLW